MRSVRVVNHMWCTASSDLQSNATDSQCLCDSSCLRTKALLCSNSVLQDLTVKHLLHQAGGAEATEAAVGAGGDTAALQAQLDEQQAEFNDLLACLGQESAKVGCQSTYEGISILDEDSETVLVSKHRRLAFQLGRFCLMPVHFRSYSCTASVLGSVRVKLHQLATVCINYDSVVWCLQDTSCCRACMPRVACLPSSNDTCVHDLQSIQLSIMAQHCMLVPQVAALSDLLEAAGTDIAPVLAAVEEEQGLNGDDIFYGEGADDAYDDEDGSDGVADAAAQGSSGAQLDYGAKYTEEGEDFTGALQQDDWAPGGDSTAGEWSAEGADAAHDSQQQQQQHAQWAAESEAGAHSEWAAQADAGGWTAEGGDNWQSEASEGATQPQPDADSGGSNERAAEHTAPDAGRPQQCDEAVCHDGGFGDENAAPPAAELAQADAGGWNDGGRSGDTLAAENPQQPVPDQLHQHPLATAAAEEPDSFAAGLQQPEPTPASPAARNSQRPSRNRQRPVQSSQRLVAKPAAAAPSAGTQDVLFAAFADSAVVGEGYRAGNGRHNDWGDSWDV